MQDGIGRVLQEQFLRPENLERLRAALNRRLEAQDGQGEEYIQVARKVVAQLDTRLARARSNLLLLEPDNIPRAQAQIRQWEQERAMAQAELNRALNVCQKGGLEQVITNVEGLLEGMRSADPAMMRVLVQKAVARVGW
jgi:hypothetical protein